MKSTKYLDSLDENFLKVAYPDLKKMTEQEKIALSFKLEKERKQAEKYMNIFVKEYKKEKTFWKNWKNKK